MCGSSATCTEGLDLGLSPFGGGGPGWRGPRALHCPCLHCALANFFPWHQSGCFPRSAPLGGTILHQEMLACLASWLSYQNAGSKSPVHDPGMTIRGAGEGAGCVSSGCVHYCFSCAALLIPVSQTHTLFHQPRGLDPPWLKLCRVGWGIPSFLACIPATRPDGVLSCGMCKLHWVAEKAAPNMQNLSPWDQNLTKARL